MPQANDSQKHRPDTRDAQDGDDAIIGRALRWSAVVILIIAAVAGGVTMYVNWPAPEPEESSFDVIQAQQRKTAVVQVPEVKFTDVTREAGIDFVHVNGAYGEKLLPETMGGGAAFFDYDNDGDQDLLLVGSCQWPWKVPLDQQPATLALYQNDGTGRFKNVTAECGLNIMCYGMGAAVGDFDNDGWCDLFISAVGRNWLFHNEEGVFIKLTETAGVGGDDEAWSTSCGWFDYNNDGLLDLFVCNYVRWNREIDQSIDSTLDGVNRAYAPPNQYEGTFPYLYRNDGDGRFTDVSEAAGLHVTNLDTGVPVAKALGVVFLDVNADGWHDIMVANDTVANQCFRNMKDGKFTEDGVELNVAFDGNGKATGAMGIDSGWFRNSDAIAIAIGNFANEPTSLYVTQPGSSMFADEATANGLGPQTRLELTFGLFFFDYDLDGRLDLLCANGHLEDEINKIQSSQHYRQPPQLFWNAGADQATELVPVPAAKVGDDFHKPMVGRGATYADIDNDGDLDVLITATGAAPRLLRNDQQLSRHWLRIKLVGRTCNRDAIGAYVEVHADGRVQRRQVSPTRSYLCQAELPVTFGLDDSDDVEKVVVHWPDGSTQQVSNVKIDALNVIEQGD